jgi:hypothetical protein
MSTSNEQLRLVNRVLNLSGVRVIDADIVNELGDAHSGMTRAFADSLLPEIAGGVLKDTPPKIKLLTTRRAAFPNAASRVKSKA